MADETPSSGDFTSSKLGTLDYWEQAYEKELTNFEDSGDVGEVWFGYDSMERVVDWLRDCPLVDQQSSVIDLGCGNGVMLVELAKEGYTNLTGVDYSANAIKLAKSIAEEEELAITYETCDILSPTQPPSKQYSVCVDKGTYDAISLNPDKPEEKLAMYLQNVHAMMTEPGLLILTSCNWTAEELISKFTQNGYFAVHEKIPSPSFSFGGGTGNRETVIVLKKLSKQ